MLLLGKFILSESQYYLFRTNKIRFLGRIEAGQGNKMDEELRENPSKFIKIKSPDHSEVLATGLWKFLTTNNKTDFNFRLGQNLISAHRLVLEVFLPPEKLSSNFIRLKLEMPDYDNSNSLDSLLEFLYKGEVSLPVEELEGLLRIARELDCQMLLDAVKSSLMLPPSNPDNAENFVGTSLDVHAEHLSMTEMDRAGPSLLAKRIGSRGRNANNRYEPRNKRVSGTNLKGSVEISTEDAAITEIGPIGPSCFEKCYASKHLNANNRSELQKRRVRGQQVCSSVFEPILDLVNPKVEFSPDSKEPGVQESVEGSKSEQWTVLQVDEIKVEPSEALVGDCDRSIDNYRALESAEFSFWGDSGGIIEGSNVSGDLSAQRIGNQKLASDCADVEDRTRMKSGKGSGSRIFRCSYCDFTVQRRDGYRRHLLAIHKLTPRGDPAPKCSECDFVARHPSEVALHQRTKHNKLKPFRCPHCQVTFSSNCSFKRHVKITHETGSDQLACKICNRRCRSNSELELHMRMHTKEKPFQCNLCRYSTGLKQNLKRHVDLVHR